LYYFGTPDVVIRYISVRMQPVDSKCFIPVLLSSRDCTTRCLCSKLDFMFGFGSRTIAFSL